MCICGEGEVLLYIRCLLLELILRASLNVAIIPGRILLSMTLCIIGKGTRMLLLLRMWMWMLLLMLMQLLCMMKRMIWHICTGGVHVIARGQGHPILTIKIPGARSH